MDNTETINNLIENDDFDKVVSSGLAPVKVMLMNGNYETRWCSTKNLDTTYFEDLDSTQQDLIQQTYPKLDYDTVVENHDNKVESWELKEGCHISQWLNKDGGLK